MKKGEANPSVNASQGTYFNTMVCFLRNGSTNSGETIHGPLQPGIFFLTSQRVNSPYLTVGILKLSFDLD